MSTLVLVRHGQSAWNQQNRFTGWADPDLTDRGILEAHAAAKKILQQNVAFGHAFTSVLKRAHRTLMVILRDLGIEETVEKYEDEALNERNYGDLQGKNKEEARKEFGEEQVHIWRRSFDTPPPNGESLKDTADRVIPYFQAQIQPLLEKGENVLIVAHGNSLRALSMHLEGMTAEAVVQFEMPTGEPRLYKLAPGLKVEAARFL